MYPVGFRLFVVCFYCFDSISAVGLQYSSFTCFGKHYFEDHHQRSCKFRNICLDVTSNQIEFYNKPNSVLFTDERGTSQSSFFPKQFVNPGLDMRGWKQEWAPRVVLTHVPQNATWLNGPAVLFEVPAKYVMENFGHVLFDILYPIFVLLDAFKMYSRDGHIVLLSDTTCSEPLCAAARPSEPFLNLTNVTTPLFGAGITHFLRGTDALTAVLFDSQPSTVGELAKSHATSTHICFKTAVVGTGRLYPAAMPYKSRGFFRAITKAFPEVNFPDEKSKVPVITVFNRVVGRRQVENMEDIVAAIHTRFPLVQFQVVNFSEVTPPVSAQVKMLHHTTVFIAPAGAISCAVAFLPPGAAALVFTYWDPKRNISLSLDRHNFEYLEHVEIIDIPVFEEDYLTTTDQPGCIEPWNSWSTMSACNLKIKHIGRILTMLDRFLVGALK